MFFKFPSTPYIESKKDKVRKDKILSGKKVEQLLSQEVYVEEKIDGANLGISFGGDGKLLFQNRGSILYPPLEGQWAILEKWVEKYEEAMFEYLADRYILFGEWCYVTHSIYYDSLPDWFVGFDVFDKKSYRFLSVKNRNQIMKQIGICFVPALGQGIFKIEQLKGFFGKSQYSSSYCEGIYLRQDEGEFLKYRAKLVREDFQQRIEEHWSKKQIRHNKICYHNFPKTSLDAASFHEV
ncbi:MAG: RNA ligase family protein [Lachnospiraceae bacterium]|jgi:ATP-dependent RNA circularization protein (DNA/RNA ligase family)|uniref:RNA ligase family protein n=1 Tax=Candidatus Merdisoma sp. JLR.KK011 TaxID=3114299 RepID=UPI0014337008|nr:RNA ligase family protein [Lachnospiraceae bacterium]MCI9479305.1 RNA ligase family protein [Lachnospiraceae bacterium]MCI9623515.1 RNA ligase family protein [Lachnospiraceae bacterium]GFI08789.1 hypothetical protein IMSAGC007_01240 [Lachnospiraceae bacterium]